MLVCIGNISIGFHVAGFARSQLVLILGAWVFAQALLDVYGYTESPATSSSSQEPVSTAQAADNTHPKDKPELAMRSPDEGSSQQPVSTAQADASTPEGKSESAMRSPEDDVLVDKGFIAQSSVSKEAKAAAHEVLVRVLETGPSSLEPVKEAVGALRALASGAVQQSTLCLNKAWLQVCLSVYVVGEHTLPTGVVQYSIFCLEMLWLQVRYSSPHYASTCLPASSVCIWQPIQFQCQRFRGKLSSPMLEDKQHTLLP